MKTEILTPSVHVAIGDKLQSNSTIFINGPDVFLVEAMASREDSEKLREYVETELLISNSTLYGSGYHHAAAEISDSLGSAKSVLFVPSALYDRDAYTSLAQKRI